VGLRDRAALAVLRVYRGKGRGARKAHERKSLARRLAVVTSLSRERRKIAPHSVRHDLERFLFEYIDRAGLRDAPKKKTLFLSAVRKEKRLTENSMDVKDLCRMVKRRMKDAGLPPSLSAHSFRVTVITDLLKQGVGPFDVQNLAGHADPRTTRLYDRRRKEVTRNLVERISI
jgi:integrase/recombinase XerD